MTTLSKSSISFADSMSAYGTTSETSRSSVPQNDSNGSRTSSFSHIWRTATSHVSKKRTIFSLRSPAAPLTMMHRSSRGVKPAFATYSQTFSSRAITVSLLSLGFAATGIILPIRLDARKWAALAKHLFRSPVKDF